MHWKSGTLTGVVVSAATIIGPLATQYIEAQYGIPQEQSAQVLGGLAGIVSGVGRGVFLWMRGADPTQARLQALEALVNPKSTQGLAAIMRARMAAKAEERKGQS